MFISKHSFNELLTELELAWDENTFLSDNIAFLNDTIKEQKDIIRQLRYERKVLCTKCDHEMDVHTMKDKDA